MQPLERPDRPPGAPAPPLPDEVRARGRRLAITSHPAGMTFTMVFTDYLPTLALVSLGASETLVGLQGGLRSSSAILQLPTLRAVGRFSKKSILIASQILALITALPLLFFGTLAAMGGQDGITIVFASLALTAIAIKVGEAVWFPLLRGYIDPDRIGNFFGTIRSIWHLALILFFGGATFWLAEHEGSFGPLFAVAWALGVVRIAVLVRLPERDERTGERVRMREALALLRHSPLLRRYLLGVSWCSAVRHVVTPFAIVMLRREVGFTSAEIIYMTVAVFAGGLVSLYLWGTVVDRAGPEPVFRWTSIGLGALYLGLLFVNQPGELVLLAMIAFFFAQAVLSAGHGVADTRVLFELTPEDAPARMLVIGSVAAAVLGGSAPIVAGLVLDRLLGTGASPLAVYHGLFTVCAVLQALSFLPLRAFRR